MKAFYFQIRVQVFAKDYSNQFQPFLVDVSFNLCEVVGRRNFVPYGVIVWKLFQRFTNANKSCTFSVYSQQIIILE